MKTTVDLQDVMGCGCNNSIHKGLSGLKGVFGVVVEPHLNRIVVEHTDEVGRDALVARLCSMGYPERASDAGTQCRVPVAPGAVPCAVTPTEDKQ